MCCPQVENGSSYRIKICGSSLTSNTWRQKMRPCPWNVFTFLVILNTGRWTKSKTWMVLRVLLQLSHWPQSCISCVYQKQLYTWRQTAPPVLPLARIKNPCCCGEFIDNAEITLLRVSVCQVTTWFRSDEISSSDLFQTWKKEQPKENSFFVCFIPVLNKDCAASFVALRT